MLRQLKIGRVIKMTKDGTYKINGKISLEKIEPKDFKNDDHVIFDTTLRMNNHLKNFMKVLVILGYAPTQQKALKRIQDSYIEQLGYDEQKALKFQIETLERSDALNSNK